jgi:GTP cyclohydrolase IB
VVAEVTSLCPCSKAVSDYGAHNQRSRVTLTVVGDLNDPYPLPALEAAELAREVGSCAVYPLIKRVDERAITMMAYDRPAFVEDMVRDLSRLCRSRGFTHDIEVQNLESIHGHDASARISWRPNAPSNSQA